MLANANVQGFPVQYYNGAVDADGATPVSVSDGVEISSIDFNLGAGGTISGTAYEADGVTPVANADIWAEIYECCGEGNGARTSGDGTYTITGLASGDYRVIAHAEGYAREFYQETSDFDHAIRVTVDAGADISGIDFTLEVGAIISGTVYQTDGVTPIADAQVWAESFKCCGGGNGTRTTGDGTYTITGLGSGDYRLEAHADGYAREFYQETSDFHLASRVTVAGGANTTGINFTLDTGASISGTVYQADGVTTVANADVRADSYQCCGGGEGTRSAADGTYTIDGLAPGDYRLEAHAPEQGLASEFYDNTTDWNLAARVTATVGQTTTDIDFSLVRGGSISGTVYEADGLTPVPNADVWADSYDCCGGGNGTRSAADGAYTIQGLVSGDYRVQARAPERGLAGEIYDNTTDWDLASSVTVSAGQTTANVDFSLAAGGSISGTVYESDGVTPVPNADLWAESYDCCGGGEGARTGVDGTYTIDGLTSGDYRVMARAPERGLAGQFYDNTTDWDLATSVTVAAGQTTANVDFSLAGGGSISGTVYEADGVTPVPNADVWADSYGCCGGGNGTRSAADGTYTVRGLASGDYRVMARAAEQGLAGEIYDNTTDWDLASSVTVSAGQTTANIDFSLAAGGSISGTVYEADGVTPVPNADVWADSYDCCGGGNGSRSAADGTYTIQGPGVGGLPSAGSGAGARSGGTVSTTTPPTGTWHPVSR